MVWIRNLVIILAILSLYVGLRALDGQPTARMAAAKSVQVVDYSLYPVQALHQDKTEKSFPLYEVNIRRFSPLSPRELSKYPIKRIRYEEKKEPQPAPTDISNVTLSLPILHPEAVIKDERLESFLKTLE